jgi:predicted Zn-dependent peptidase
MTADELAGVKRRARADFIRSLDSNMGLARQLAYYQELTGSWHNMFRQLDKIDAVTLPDCQRVATGTLVTSNRTVALLKTIKTGDQGSH